jgi:diaminohydroxyphosphoribosylaminopyrimidine deaminase/5-amino-6-(5-phosphoribosylamino)uracil reductase
MAGLWTRERRLVLLEGGPTLAGSFLRSGLVDRVVAYVAPAVLGGGLPSVLVPTVTTLSDAVRLEVIDVARIGPDVRLTARPVPREGAS